MKIDNKMCKAMIADLQSCAKWNSFCEAMSIDDRDRVLASLDVVNEVFSELPDTVESKDHVEVKA